MRQKIIFLTLLFTSLNLFSQIKEIRFLKHNNTSKLLLVQTNCNSNLRIKIKLQCIDTIKCRTDSIFATINPDYFHFKSYDSHGFLRIDGSLHVHLNRVFPEAKIILTPLYQDSLSAEDYSVYDANGKFLEEVHFLCDFYLSSSGWEDFGTDEFGTKK